MNIYDIIILVLISIIIYTYIGYLILLFILSKFINNKCETHINNFEPPVTIILVFRNEEDKIIEKVKNLINLNYDKEKVSIILVNDHSTDNSIDILNKFINNNLSIVNPILILTNSGNGKAMGINTAVEYIKSLNNKIHNRLIMLCDTRQIFDRKALKNMVLRFQDDKIGYVSGEIKLKGKQAYGLYWKYEKKIRELESTIYSTVGGIGPISMVRLDLIPELPENLILDDVFIPISVCFSKKRCVYEKTALAYDKEYSTKDELNRKYRTLTGNFQLFSIIPKLLSPKSNPLFFQFISHKFLRLIIPVIVFLILSITMISYIFTGSVFSMTLLLLQGIFYTISIITIFIKIPVLNLSNQFLSFIIAPVVGFYRYIRKDYKWTGIEKKKKN